MRRAERSRSRARAASGFYGNDGNGMATLKGSNVGVGAEVSFFGF